MSGIFKGEKKESKTGRVMIAAPGSGSGKTLVTCAVLGALKRKGLSLCAFKCGPDYIDPMFHKAVLNIPSENLDTWFSGAEGAGDIFRSVSSSYDMAVIEGVMGLFDGIGAIEIEGSSYDAAVVTGTNVILVIDAHGMGRSVLPVIKGFLDSDSEGLIKGIILNRISESFYNRLKPFLDNVLEADYSGVNVIGFFPPRKDLAFSSRYLGLILPGEKKETEEQLEKAALQAEQSIDIDMLLKIAGYTLGSHEVNEMENDDTAACCIKGRPLLAVARDEAFCFYYEANLRLLRQMGADLVFFSPLHDRKLPENISGLLLGGGYPELYGKELSENITMREDIRKHIEAGIPSLAECGGFMYLHDSITDQAGKKWPGVGTVTGSCRYSGKLSHFGYIELKEKEPVFLSSKDTIRGHEFHYYISSNEGNACVAEKPGNAKSWECIDKTENHFWGFPHLYYPSATGFVSHFISEMKKYGKFL